MKRGQKRRVAAICLMIVAVLATFGGCTPTEEDFLEPLCAPAEYKVKGSVRGVEIQAQYTLAAVTRETAASGMPRAVTITFYAPSSLAGTVLSRDEGGRISFSPGGRSVTGAAAAALQPLFDVFPTAGSVSKIEKSPTGSLVVGEDFALTFAPDGRLLSVTRDRITLYIE